MLSLCLISLPSQSAALAEPGERHTLPDFSAPSKPFPPPTLTSWLLNTRLQRHQLGCKDTHAWLQEHSRSHKDPHFYPPCKNTRAATAPPVLRKHHEVDPWRDPEACLLQEVHRGSRVDIQKRVPCMRSMGQVNLAPPSFASRSWGSIHPLRGRGFSKRRKVRWSSCWSFYNNWWRRRTQPYCWLRYGSWCGCRCGPACRD